MRSIATILALALIAGGAVLGDRPAHAQGAPARGRSFADDLRGAGIPATNTSGAAAGRGLGIADEFSGPDTTPTPSDTPAPPTPTPTPGCQMQFGGECDPERGADGCCVVGYDAGSLPCIGNESSGGAPICTDVIGPSTCQPQNGLPCQAGGYENCCDPTAACVNGRCQSQ